MSPFEDVVFTIKAFDTFQAVAKRICRDGDIANDLAMEEFEKFVTVRNPRSEHGTNVRAYAWKVIAAKYKQFLKDEWKQISPGRFDEDDKFHNLLPCRETQEDYVEARMWLPVIDGLPEPCRSAIQILAGGGSVTDVILDLQLSPKGAIHAINEGRRLIKLSARGEDLTERIFGRAA